MERRYLLFGSLALVWLAIAIALWAAPRHDAAAVSLHLHSVTNDTRGDSVAVLGITKHRPVAVLPDSFGQKAGDEWVWQPMPTSVWQPSPTNLTAVQCLNYPGVGRPAIVRMRFPVSGPWRLRLAVVEPRAGIEGLMERFRHPVGYYRMGGVLNVAFGWKPSRYTGRLCHVESEDIR